MIEFPITLTSGGSVCLPGRAYALALGYTKNRGVYRLHVDATGEWAGLAIRCFWHVPDGKDPASSLVVDGYVDVPASVTAQPGSGCITFEGSDGAKVMTSADLRYRVSANSGTEDGTEPEPGTPAWQQLVDAVHTDATAAEQAKTDAQTAAQQAGQALSDTITAKDDALKAIGDKQTAATQAVDTARDKALQQVEASTKAAETAASEATTSAGNASQSAQEAAGSLQELKDSIANGNFKGEPGNDGKSPVVTVTDIENGHRVSITDKDGTKTIDVLNGKDGKDAPQIDDTTVIDSAPWSSKHLVDMLCPPISETGNPAQFCPVAGYPLGCKVSWEPTQEGSGTPSPENIRPIKGRDSVTVTRCGENLFNPAWMPEKVLNNGLTWTITSDGTVTANGTTNETSYYNSNYFSLPAGAYTISAMSHFRISIINRDAGYLTIAAQQIGKPCTFTVENYIQKTTLFFAASGTLDNVSAKPQIEKGTTATTYAPYTGQTATLTLPSTIYGGTVDAVTGEGQETWKLLTLDGTEKWVFYKTYGMFCISANGHVNSAKDIAPMSNFYKGVLGFSNIQNAQVGVSNGTPSWLFGIKDERFETTSAFSSYLAAQYAAGTPVQVCYKLATPTPFAATGAQPVPALSGVNTILTDADSATVTGRADPIKRITDLEDAVASMTTT